MLNHDDVIKWKHLPRYWPFVRGIHRSPVNSPHKGQWCGALIISLIWATWISGWVNNRDAGDFRRHRSLYDVTVMFWHQSDNASWVIIHSRDHIGPCLWIRKVKWQQTCRYHWLCYRWVVDSSSWPCFLKFCCETKTYIVSSLPTICIIKEFVFVIYNGYYQSMPSTCFNCVSRQGTWDLISLLYSCIICGLFT